mmetsp:Transcript_3282/g.4826  ORF Transcript_3282/g.4826 Transcript_3282/m.4826 type:complete len:118 (-) Transcript_3282:59-412(-)
MLDRPSIGNEEKEPETVSDVTAIISDFSTARLWTSFHTPRSLTLALMGEMGELAELVQFRTDLGKSNSEDFFHGWTEKEIEHLGQEFADVSIYLLRLADICSIRNLGEVAESSATAL